MARSDLALETFWSLGVLERGKNGAGKHGAPSDTSGERREMGSGGEESHCPREEGSSGPKPRGEMKKRVRNAREDVRKGGGEATP